MPERRVVQVDGMHFSAGGEVRMDYSLKVPGEPETTSFGQENARANGNGAFTTRIDVRIVGRIVAEVTAADLATNRITHGLFEQQ